MEAEKAFHHTQKVLFANNEEVRLLLELIYNGNNVLQDCWWRWVKRSEIPPTELAQLAVEAEQLKQKRLKKAFAERGKIGRNDSCPCGSGKKYKRCCWLK
jgi:preprotein translocase subunit SecA